MNKKGAGHALLAILLVPVVLMAVATIKKKVQKEENKQLTIEEIIVGEN